MVTQDTTEKKLVKYPEDNSYSKPSCKWRNGWKRDRLSSFSYKEQKKNRKNFPIKAMKA
jgi:hypothetical protein